MSGQGLPVIPRESKTTQSLVLALFVHAALIAFLWIGVSWQTEGGSSAEAEVWDIVVREAAPAAMSAAPEAEVVQEEAAQQALPEPAKPQPQEQPLAKAEPPDIALRAEEKKKEDKKKEKEKEEAKRQQEAQERQKAEAKKKEAEAKEKAVAAKEKQLKLADQKKADALLEQEARRLAGRSGTGGNGTAAYSTGGSVGADAGYVQKVSAKIKSNTLFNVPAGLSGNPPVEYDVELLPDGSIKAMKKRRSSGVPGFDEAVRRAIEKSAPFPPNQVGKVPSRFEVSHKPKG